MSAASGPPCVKCARRVSAHWITRCPWCLSVLCMKCECPKRCAARFLAPKPEEPKQ